MIYPTFRQLEAFVHVARLGSFTSASHALRLSQPALSQTISQLELVLETKVFDRTTRSVSLTAMGQHFLLIAERVLLDLDAGLQDLRKMTTGERGVVMVGCLSSIGLHLLPPIVGVFASRYPKIKVLLRDDNSAGVLRRLRIGEVEFAISTMPDSEPDYAFEPLLRDPLLLLCHKNDALACRGTIRWKELAGKDFLAMEHGTHLRRLIDHALPSLSVLMKPRYEASNVATIVGLVEAGLGPAVLSALCCPHHGELKRVQLVNPLLFREIGIISRRDRTLSPAAERFCAAIRESLVGDPLPNFSGISLLAPAGRQVAKTSEAASIAADSVRPTAPGTRKRGTNRARGVQRNLARDATV